MLDDAQAQLLRHVADATRGQYRIVALLGVQLGRGSAYVARDSANGGLALLVATPDGEALDVLPALGDAVPAGGGRCTACGAAPTTWTAACARCDRSLTPPAATDDMPAPAAPAVAAAAGSAVEVLGALPHDAGGGVVFGRDRADGRLVAYAARPVAGGGLWLDPLWEGELAPEHLVRPATLFDEARPGQPAGGPAA